MCVQAVNNLWNALIISANAWQSYSTWLESFINHLKHCLTCAIQPHALLASQTCTSYFIFQIELAAMLSHNKYREHEKMYVFFSVFKHCTFQTNSNSTHYYNSEVSYHYSIQPIKIHISKINPAKIHSYRVQYTMIY